MTVDFILNGEDVSAKVNPVERLVQVLNQHFGLASLLQDCGLGQCGKCMILLDGKLAYSCLVPAFRVKGAEVISYEGFQATAEHEIIKEAFQQAHLELCPYCTPAIHLAAGSLLDRPIRPLDQEITDTMAAIYCRCTALEPILETVRGIIEQSEGRKYRRAR
jgi:carbon-monoxide dehydrogenase small subunit